MLIASWMLGAALYAAAEPPKTGAPTSSLKHEIAAEGDESLNSMEELLKEPKDENWSAPMEQRIERYVTAHPQGRKFELTNVDCRKTFCLIEATGVDDASFIVYQRVMWDLLDQPWSTFERHLGRVESKVVNHMRRFEIVLTRTGAAKR